ncbi:MULTISPECIES: pyrroline-5-carboxylate reductase [Pseudomonas]|uniref:Pyrroline-5-carboxylate reductase n=1 Tax=Pseudomonas taiwanensis TaxID=470150 RepID=A0ABR6V1V2_9PSED|nr:MULTISPECIES: pyrroline-5-carboxylate reductase [Pseudomonas]AVD89860.1 pyrroline-5-carboxylate reductase [Pseudomonas sp. SWI44]MBC3474398.1 pyrroline-5-carboxylate reductase [Pseudomonas taiwanensis]MBC3489667.1 pyrroline-5-carboxylate reductase [Pseudomonas taiwanensis]
MNALFLGYGRMGSAIAQAWLEAGLVSHISAVDPYLQTASHATLYNDVAALPTIAYDIIVVAVKPNYACEVLSALPPGLCQQAVVISVAAGVTSQKLSQALGHGCPVVRAMPNTPVLVGAGCTGLFAPSGLSERQRAQVTRLFSAVGTASWVEQEGLLDAVTALSGSGPAYYHLFSEALAAAGIELGLSPELAKTLAAQTALGAATLQTQADADFVALRTAVTSPNGTTAAAIGVFEHESALRRLVETAVRSASRRSEELSRES